MANFLFFFRITSKNFPIIKLGILRILQIFLISYIVWEVFQRPFYLLAMVVSTILKDSIIKKREQSRVILHIFSRILQLLFLVLNLLLSKNMMIFEYTTIHK